MGASIAIGAAVGAVTSAISGGNPLQGAAMGAVTGGIGGGISGLVGGIEGGLAEGATGGFLTGADASWFAPEFVDAAVASGAVSSAADITTGGLGSLVESPMSIAYNTPVFDPSWNVVPLSADIADSVIYPVTGIGANTTAVPIDASMSFWEDPFANVYGAGTEGSGIIESGKYYAGVQDPVTQDWYWSSDIADWGETATPFVYDEASGTMVSVPKATELGLDLPGGDFYGDGIIDTIEDGVGGYTTSIDAFGSGGPSVLDYGLGGARLVQSLLGAGAALRAGNAMQAAGNAAAQNQMQMYQQTRADLLPYQAMGLSGANALTQLTGLEQGGQPLQSFLLKPFAESPWAQQEALEATPGYQFALSQGLRAGQNRLAAQGLGRSGAAVRGAEEYATGLADQTYGNQFDRYWAERKNIGNTLGSIVSGGQSAANQTGNLGYQAANAAGGYSVGAAQAGGAGLIGATNALGGGLNAIQNMYMNNQLMDAVAQGQRIPGMYT